MGRIVQRAGHVQAGRARTRAKPGSARAQRSRASPACRNMDSMVSRRYLQLTSVRMVSPGSNEKEPASGMVTVQARVASRSISMRSASALYTAR